jgi:hypothetical protein
MGINIPIKKDIHKRLSVYFQLFMIYGYKHVKDSDFLGEGQIRERNIFIIYERERATHSRLEGATHALIRFMDK